MGMERMQIIKGTFSSRKLAITVFVICLVILLTWLGLKNVNPNSPDVAEIKRVMLKAIETNQSLGQLPEPYCSNPQNRVPDEIKRIAIEKVKPAVSTYYSLQSPLFEKRVQELQDSINAQDLHNYRVLGAGISKYKNVKIKVHGDTAIADADIWIWLKGIEQSNKVYSPDNGLHFQFTLVKEEDKWKIADETSKFLPGEGP